MHQAQWSPERPLPPPVSLASQSHLEKPPEFTCTSRGTPGCPSSTRLEARFPYCREFYATASCQRAIFISVSRYGRQGFYGNFVYLKLVFRKLFLLQILQTDRKGSSLVRSSFLP